MGRTRRKRNQKMRNFHTCDNTKEAILLNSWLIKQGKARNKKLTLAVFDDTGRGVLTRKKIKPGEELINLPLNLTINVISILLDSSFRNVFLENKKQCLLDYRCSVSFQALMAYYLSFLKVQGKNTKWYVYLESLPKHYTVPYFLPNELLNYIDPDILSVISKQKAAVQSSFQVFQEILENNISNNAAVIKFKKYFTLSLYEWAYFTVNTRCVYMDLTNLIDFKNRNSLLNLISDNTKISLCPFLDMINHSPNAKNETKLVVNKNFEIINISDLEENLFSGVRFSIYTKNNFNSYSQVFICYGDSHNLKLITEYGFYLPNNDLDYVTFNIDYIQDFFNNTHLKLSQEQISFINNHGLNKALYIDNKGLSFNFYALLMVVKYYYDKNTDVSKLIYSAAICSDNSELRQLILPMVKDKIVNCKQLISNLETYSKESVSLSNCVAYMCQQIKILEKFIKC